MTEQDISEMMAEIESKVEEKDEKIERMEAHQRVEQRRREKYQEDFAWEKFDNLVNISEYVDRDEVEFDTHNSTVEVHISSPQTTLKLIIEEEVGGDRSFEARFDTISGSMWDDNVEDWTGYEKSLKIIANGGDLICSDFNYIFETVDGDLFEIDFEEGTVSSDVNIPSNWFRMFEGSNGRIEDDIGDLVAVEEDYNGMYYIFERYTIKVESFETGQVRQKWVRVDADNVLLESERDVIEVDESYRQQAVALSI